MTAERPSPVLFLIHFTDKPGSTELRQRLLAEHLAWLAERRDVVLVAGSLREEPDANAVGGCWIVRADSRSAAERIFESDPFWIAGLRQTVQVWHWWVAFPGQTVTF